MRTRPQNRSLLSLRPWRLAAACALALAPTVAPAANEATLKVGEPAPALALKKFVKGEPVPAFEKDKVYVVEFWATGRSSSRQNSRRLMRAFLTGKIVFR